VEMNLWDSLMIFAGNDSLLFRPCSPRPRNMLNISAPSRYIEQAYDR